MLQKLVVVCNGLYLWAKLDRPEHLIWRNTQELYSVNTQYKSKFKLKTKQKNTSFTEVTTILIYCI